MAAHARRGASSSHRWIACPGSLNATEGLPNESSVYALEGTAAHHLASHCLLNDVEPGELIDWCIWLKDGAEPEICRLEPAKTGAKDVVIEINDEMAEAVDVYLDFARKMTEPGDEREVEQRFNLDHFYPEMFGTADLVVYKEAEKRLIVADFKYGRGVPVDVTGNPQLRYYALGAATRHHNRPLETIDIYIVQPRCPHPDGPVRHESVAALDLLDWSADLVEAAKRTEDPNAPLFAGEWCKFCPAVPTCPALAEYALKVASAEFDDATGVMTVSDPKKLDSKQLAMKLGQIAVVEDWCRAFREFAHHEAEAGRLPDGYKLVPTRPTRFWKDPETTAEALRDLAVPDDKIFAPPKLRSPAQVEKAIGAKNAPAIADLWSKASKGTVLVPLADPRAPALPEAETQFTNVG